MKYKWCISIYLFIQISALCHAQALEQTKIVQEPYYFNTDSLISNIKVLSSDDFEGRRTDTRGAEKAKDYIIKKLQSFKNIQSLANDYQQPFAFTTRGKAYEGVNILGLVKGTKYPQDYIVISAHYDHEGIKNNQIYNGADDDASGVAALFAFAEYFEKNPPEHSVILAAFDGEELGLSGSKHYVANPIVPLKSIKLNINMDMISRNDKNELYAVGTIYNATLKKVISSHESTNGIKLLIGHDGNDGLQDWTNSSDHAPFHNYNIPFIYFGVEDHKDYHQPTDTFENIHPEFYKQAVYTIISIFNTLDQIRF